MPQMEAAECGVACLAMVLAAHGRHVGLAELREACGVSRDGTSALAILRAGERYGLEAAGVRAEPADLRTLPTPAILHWGFDHFVVLERAGRRGAVLVDPASGRRRAGPAELDRAFTGAALVFEPGPGFARLRRPRPSLARYRAVLRESLPALAFLLLAAAALQVAGLVAPVSTRILLDHVILPRREPWLWGLGAALGAAGLASVLLTCLQGRVAATLHARMDDALMGAYLEHLLRLPWAFFARREPGDLLARAGSLAAVRAFLGGSLARVFLDGALLAAYAGLMVAYHPRLGLLVMGLGAAQAAASLLLRARTRQMAASEAAAAGREAGALLEALTAFETLKATGGGPRMVLRWTHRMAARVEAGLGRRRLELAAGAALDALAGAGAAAVFLLGGREVLAGRMTLGVFVAFLALQGLFLAPLGALLEAWGEVLQLGVHLRRLDDVLETAPEPTGPRDPGRLKGAIRLRDVGFRHAAGAAPVLRGISLDVRPGEKIALVGPSGAGKSTLARILLGLQVPTEGSVHFDGVDLRELDLAALRRQMGAVLQDDTVFDDTFRANVALGVDGAAPEALARAARLACVEGVILARAGGWSGRAGEGGAALSGGQRQRLCLARALAREPAILVLDEATSSLDLATEAEVHRNLAALGCTRILVAHRLATVRDADRILVLAEGRIVQEGAYGDLEARPGPFRDLVRAAHA
ncbi:NHLP family bacteriocin export ABC transporter peptidase/permease/ATPase [Mesoterricola sediminis]|uniref:NHLP family bacteriocin export ABC transporter peptidase/permease/ATPase n=1 Tax=Mesoterricola sediminis TaxID=2927980 RepID=A0AA48H1U4_9BACT|nr:NHLP family bacteriocin export ABC transporter peptidase/permease/ATPase [Mesoterricola sediminis]